MTRRLAAVMGILALSAGAVAGCSDDPTAPTALDGGASTTADAATGEGCERTLTDGWSVARAWDEAALSAIRRDFPAPTVHARNLYHLSAVMWDAWTAYDDPGRGVFADLDRPVPDGMTADDAREIAMSYAAHDLLVHRYGERQGGDDTLVDLADTMAALCLDPAVTSDGSNDPVAIGRSIAETAIEAGRRDGALEDSGYLSETYQSLNEPLAVSGSGTSMVDPDRWQPLQMDNAQTQNGQQTTNVQNFIGSHWGQVTPFALATTPGAPAIDPGPPPRLADPTTHDEVLEAVLTVLERSAALEPGSAGCVDISPARVGDNALGTNDGDGYAENPVTGDPYEPSCTDPADFGRVVAEYWADGPHSETPPGHWNVLANQVSDDDRLPHRIEGAGDEVGRLEWDTRLYVALNGALHDAAIAAWGLKATYDSSRPISLIRHLGGLGQSSDPDRTGYDPGGLPLVPGLVELVTDETSAPGGRHAHLVGAEGQVAVRAFDPLRRDPQNVAGVGWVLAVDWMPFQLPTFVTPSFPGYVSGHSTFSRAGAEVLAAFTGSPYFPGGLHTSTTPAETLTIDVGPTADVSLQWASYFDAADQAGQSRIWGGIHVPYDDLPGRLVGAEVGRRAWARAQDLYAG